MNNLTVFIHSLSIHTFLQSHIHLASICSVSYVTDAALDPRSNQSDSYSVESPNREVATMLWVLAAQWDLLQNLALFCAVIVDWVSF